MQVEYTVRATEDLAEIWLYSTIKWSEKQADYYLANILNCISNLRSQNLIGKSYSKYMAGIYGIACNNHIIFYRLNERGLIIVRILHQRMDLETRIKE